MSSIIFLCYLSHPPCLRPSYNTSNSRTMGSGVQTLYNYMTLYRTRSWCPKHRGLTKSRWQRISKTTSPSSHFFVFHIQRRSQIIRRGCPISLFERIRFTVTKPTKKCLQQPLTTNPILHLPYAKQVRTVFLLRDLYFTITRRNQQWQQFTPTHSNSALKRHLKRNNLHPPHHQPIPITDSPSHALS